MEIQKTDEYTSENTNITDTNVIDTNTTATITPDTIDTGAESQKTEAPVLILFGKQCSGKGTVAEMLAKDYGYTIVGSGDLLRKIAKEDSDLGREVASYQLAGKLVSSEIVMEVVKDYISKLPAGSKIAFDGVPRAQEQATELNETLTKSGKTFQAILINISDETAEDRIVGRRGCPECKRIYGKNYKEECCEDCDGVALVTRSDDTVEKLKDRLNEYKTKTAPTIEVYKENLIEIDGERSPKGVARQVRKTMREVLGVNMLNK